jgi:hypothetical protein
VFNSYEEKTWEKGITWNAKALAPYTTECIRLGYRTKQLCCLGRKFDDESSLNINTFTMCKFIVLKWRMGLNALSFSCVMQCNTPNKPEQFSACPWRDFAAEKWRIRPCFEIVCIQIMSHLEYLSIIIYMEIIKRCRHYLVSRLCCSYLNRISQRCSGTMKFQVTGFPCIYSCILLCVAQQRLLRWPIGGS